MDEIEKAPVSWQEIDPWLKEFMAKGVSLVTVLYNESAERIDRSSAGDWIQTAIELLRRRMSSLTAPAAAGVPLATRNPHKGGSAAYLATEHFNEGWNACREAMMKAHEQRAVPLPASQLAVQLERAQAFVPKGYALVPLDLLRRVSDVMGRFLSDEGWCMGDMDVSDELGALLAAQPQGEEVPNA